jgi:hypothetical protein
VDIFERINLHVVGSRERDEWAKRAIDLLEQRKEKAGLAAAMKVEALDKNVKTLESAKS